jgi:hypothetical protein
MNLMSLETLMHLEMVKKKPKKKIMGLVDLLIRKVLVRLMVLSRKHL